MCHYPLQAIPLTLPETRLLIALRIPPNRDTEKKHHSHGCHGQSASMTLRNNNKC